MSMLGHYSLLFEKLGLVKTKKLTFDARGYAERAAAGVAHPLESSRDICPPWWPTYPNLPNWDYDLVKLKPNKLRGCIHVGAWDCAELGCYVPLFGENVVWVEANPHTYARITEPRASAYGHRTFNVALSDVDEKEVVLNIMPQADSSSIYECVGASPTEKIKLQTKTLDTLIAEEGIDMDNHNFLNIDAEGAEFDVLEGMKSNLHKIDYLFLEASLYERHRGAKNFKQLHEYVTDKGFKLFQYSDSFKTLKWGDVFYVRDTSE